MFKWIAIFSLLANLLIAGGGYFFYTQQKNAIELLQAQNETLKVTVGVLEEANEVTQQTLDSTIEANKRTVDRLSNLQRRMNDSEQTVTNLRSLLQKHNLTNLAENRPGLIERRINDATQKAFDELERITGTD